MAGCDMAAAYLEIPVHYPKPCWAEVDPEAWWRGTVHVTRQALAEFGIPPVQIVGVGVTGLMHAPVLLDGDGTPVAPAMLWMDQRCAHQSEALRRERENTGIGGA